MKHFIDIDNFNYSELRAILSFAKKLKKDPNKYSKLLKDKSLGTIFEKESTRTRLSFIIGVKNLGGNIVELQSSQIGFGTRESEKDILKVMSQFLDVVMIRNDNHQQLVSLASMNILPIINGLSDFSHPCQILSDIFTIEEAIGRVEDKKIVWMGDYNNVLISFIHAAEIFKFKLVILTSDILLKKHKKLFKNKKLLNCFFYKDVNKGLKDADCVMTDTWVSMGEKNSIMKKKSLRRFQVNQTIMNKAKKNAIFMHCLPAHRNEEVTDEVIDSKYSVVLTQAKNRMYVQQSILNHLLKNVKK